MSIKSLVVKLKGVQKRSRRLGGDAEDALLRGLTSAVKEQFKTRGAVGKHGRWEPNRRPPRRKQMRDTRRLYKSLTKPTSPDLIFRPYGRAIGFGTGVPYARYHQEGTARMPKRRLVDLSKKQLRVINKLWLDAVTKDLKGK